MLLSSQKEICQEPLHIHINLDFPGGGASARIAHVWRRPWKTGIAIRKLRLNSEPLLCKNVVVTAVAALSLAAGSLDMMRHETAKRHLTPDFIGGFLIQNDKCQRRQQRRARERLAQFSNHQLHN